MLRMCISAAGSLDGQLGGGQVYVQRLAIELRRRGHDVTVLAPNPCGDDAKRTGDGFRLLRREFQGVPVQDVAIDPAAVTGAARFTERNAVMLAALRQVVRELRPDVIHINGLKPALTAVAREAGIPHVVTAHHGGIVCPAGALLTPDDRICDRPMGRDCVTCYCRQLRGPGWVGAMLGTMPRWICRPLGRGLARFGNPTYIGRVLRYPWLVERMISDKRAALATGQLFIAPSAAIAAALRRNGVEDDRVVVVPHGIEPPPKLPLEGLGRRPVRFGYIGQINRPKGLHILFRAFAALPEKLGCELHVIGAPQRPGEEEYLRRSMACCEGRRGIVLHGRIARDEMTGAMGHFDVLVHPAIYLEVFGLVVAEAMSAGRPLIATRCGGPEDQIRDGVDGILVKPNDVAALAGAMRDLAERPERIAQMAQAIGHVRTMEEHVDALVRVYERLIARERAVVA